MSFVRYVDGIYVPYSPSVPTNQGIGILQATTRTWNVNFYIYIPDYYSSSTVISFAIAYDTQKETGYWKLLIANNCIGRN